MLGGGGVGKSSITIQFIQHEFSAEYDPTIEDSYRKQVEVDYKHYLLDILDTAGQEEYSAMRDSYIRTGHGFVFVYSITTTATFNDIENLHTAVLRAKDRDSIPCLLVGNKIDLEGDRQVSTEMGKQLASKLKCPHFESSAKTRVNIDELFHEIVREVRNFRNQHPTFGVTSQLSKSKGKKPQCSLI